MRKRARDHGASVLLRHVARERGVASATRWQRRDDASCVDAQACGWRCSLALTVNSRADISVNKRIDLASSSRCDGPATTPRIRRRDDVRQDGSRRSGLA